MLTSLTDADLIEMGYACLGPLTWWRARIRQAVECGVGGQQYVN